MFREQYNKGDDLVRFKAADLKKWAKDIGLDPAKFDQCLDSESYKNEVLKDKADGDAVSVRGRRRSSSTATSSAARSRTPRSRI